MSSFLHATTKDNGIYSLVRKHELYTSFPNELWEPLSALHKVQQTHLTFRHPYKMAYGLLIGCGDRANDISKVNCTVLILFGKDA